MRWRRTCDDYLGRAAGAAATMGRRVRRLFRSRGGGGRHDVLITEEAVGPVESDEDLDAHAAYKKAWSEMEGLSPQTWRGQSEGGGQALRGCNRRAGQRNRCYRCDSEYNLAPKCPWRDTPRRHRSSTAKIPREAPQERDKARKLSYSTISMDTPASAKTPAHLNSGETWGENEQAFSTTLDKGGPIPVSK